eukprot:7421548-Alexandrium_andersonii.AAC.1
MEEAGPELIERFCGFRAVAKCNALAIQRFQAVHQPAAFGQQSPHAWRHAIERHRVRRACVRQRLRHIQQAIVFLGGDAAPPTRNNSNPDATPSHKAKSSSFWHFRAPHCRIAAP